MFSLLIVVAVIVIPLLHFFVARKTSRSPSFFLTSIIVLIGLGIFSIGAKECIHTWYTLHDFKQTTCQITKQIPSANLIPQTTGGITVGNTKGPLPVYCPQLLLSYVINQAQYTSSLALPCVNSQSEQNRTFELYVVGQTRMCWYDSNTNGNVILQLPSYSLSSLFLMVVGLYLIVWIIYKIASQSTGITADKSQQSQSTSTQQTGSLVNQFILSQFMQPSGKPISPASTGPLSQRNRQVRRHPFLFIFLILVLLGAMGYWTIYPVWQARSQFVQTTCSVLDKKLITNFSNGSISYEAVFKLNYAAEGKSYTTWHAASIVPEASSRGDASYDAYAVGQTYACWYNPKMPEIAVLNLSYGYLGFIVIGFLLVMLFAVIWSI